jgi:hypothetical protein
MCSCVSHVLPGFTVHQSNDMYLHKSIHINIYTLCIYAHAFHTRASRIHRSTKHGCIFTCISHIYIYAHLLPGFTDRRHVQIRRDRMHVHRYIHTYIYTRIHVCTDAFHTCFQDALIDIMSKFGEIEFAQIRYVSINM